MNNFTAKMGRPHTLIAETSRLIQSEHADSQSRSWRNVPLASGKGDKHPQAEGLDLEKKTSISCLRRSSDFYPEEALLVDLKGDAYTLKGRKRRKLNIPVPRGISPVLVAKPDLLGIPAGEPINASGDIRSWPFEPEHAQPDITSNAGKVAAEGSIVAASNAPEVWYQISEGKRRRFVSGYAAERWGISSRHVQRIPPELLHTIPEGWPIIAPPQLLTQDL